MADKQTDEMTKLEQIWWRYTDPGVLVREGLPERLLAYEHVMYLFDEIRRLQEALAEKEPGG